MPTLVKILGREFLINLDFNENNSNWNRNEIRSAFFRNNSLSLYTTCAFYKDQDKNGKVPATITTEASDKSRVTSKS